MGRRHVQIEARILCFVTHGPTIGATVTMSGVGPRFPLPSLARAAADFRAARAHVEAGGHDVRHREVARLRLHHALRIYVGALERDGLPVARKLRSELDMLDTLDQKRTFR